MNKSVILVAGHFLRYYARVFPDFPNEMGLVGEISLGVELACFELPSSGPKPEDGAVSFQREAEQAGEVAVDLSAAPVRGPS